MVVRGKTVYHCLGKKKGKKIRTYKTAKVARAAHKRMS
jgi:hypothetical protein